MSESERPKNFIDKFFDGADAVVGAMEGGASLVDKEDIEDAEIVSVTHVSKTSKPSLIWGAINTDHHLFEGFALTSLCARTYENSDFKYRKTELDIDGIINCCGTCLRVLHSRYKNA